MTQDTQDTVISIHSDIDGVEMADESLSEKVEANKESKFITIRNFSSNTFTPFKIKDLSPNGRKYMGYYGMITLTIVIIILVVDLYALLDENLIVIVNVMLPITISLLSLGKGIALALHVLLKQFK